MLLICFIYMENPKWLKIHSEGSVHKNHVVIQAYFVLQRPRPHPVPDAHRGGNQSSAGWWRQESMTGCFLCRCPSPLLLEHQGPGSVECDVTREHEDTIEGGRLPGNTEPLGNWPPRLPGLELPPTANAHSLNHLRDLGQRVWLVLPE